MPILYQASSKAMLSLKLLVISTTVLSAAIFLKFYFPVVADFTVYEVPSLYNGLVSWLRPPYLYLVINCIILTIVASSKLQSTKDDGSPPRPLQTIPAMDSVQSQPMAALPAKISQTDYSAADSSGFSGHEVKMTEKGSDLGAYHGPDALQITQNELPTIFSVDAADSGGACAEDAMNDKENQYVIQKSSWNTTEVKIPMEYSPSNIKPPFSTRLGHRRNVKSSPEGGRTVLGVSKQRKNDTLESTWRTITEGRAMPLTRHLRKSDTWERDTRHIHSLQEKTMTKAETFQDRTNHTRSPSPAGKPRKEPSLSQDELNRRVEAFINKFNEEMRLQRQESLNQYKEMIKRGAH